MHRILKTDMSRFIVDARKVEKDLEMFGQDRATARGEHQQDNLMQLAAHIKRMDLDLNTMLSDCLFLGRWYWKSHNVSLIDNLHRSFTNLNNFLNGLTRMEMGLREPDICQPDLGQVLQDWLQFKKSIKGMHTAMHSIQYRRKHSTYGKA